MPAKVISSGTVTWRSTSSADAPGNWAKTSIMAGAGSGYASTLMLRNENIPTTESAIAKRMTTSGLCSAHSISLRTISDYPNNVLRAPPEVKHNPLAGRFGRAPECLASYLQSPRNGSWAGRSLLGRLGFFLEQGRLQLADPRAENSLPGQQRLLGEHSKFFFFERASFAFSERLAADKDRFFKPPDEFDAAHGVILLRSVGFDEDNALLTVIPHGRRRHLDDVWRRRQLNLGRDHLSGQQSPLLVVDVPLDLRGVIVGIDDVADVVDVTFQGSAADR